MPFTNDAPLDPAEHRYARHHLLARVLGALLATCGIIGCTMVAPPKPAITLSRSVDVPGSPAEVWAAIGGFCAIADWHPAIRACNEDNKTPTTRTLVTKADGAVFVELQTDRNDAAHRYTYTFVSSPVPVTRYSSTFQVVGKGAGVSTVIWSGAYVAEPGTALAAANALSGIYESGLTAIQTKLGK
jgi:hypothetical protein